MTKFKLVPREPGKRPVGRPRKRAAATATTSSKCATSASGDSVVVQKQSQETQDELPQDTRKSDEQPPVAKKRGKYRSYSLGFKMSVVEEVHKCQESIADVAAKYGVPRTTILSWENQLRAQNTKVPKTVRGVHLHSGSGRLLSYPTDVDDEIAEWILVRRDAHLPVCRELVKVKARHLIKPHNTQFTASDGWLQKFMFRHGLSLRTCTSISLKLPAQLEKKVECFLNEVRVLRSVNNYPINLIINMDETPMFFDMVPEQTISKKGVKEVRVHSSGAQKKKLTVTLTCTGDGRMLPALVIFKGKRKLKFKTPEYVHVAVQKKGWMDSELMVRWLRGIVLPYTEKRKALLVIDSFSAHMTEEFIDEAKANNIDVAIIPGGCTSKIQPLDVCLNKPFKSVLRNKWLEYIESLVEHDPNPSRLITPTKQLCTEWIKAGLDLLKEKEEMVKKSFLVCGITNALDGSENDFIRCAKELPTLQVPYIDESNDDPFQDELEESDTAESESDSNAHSDCT